MTDTTNETNKLDNLIQDGRTIIKHTWTQPLKYKKFSISPKSTDEEKQYNPMVVYVPRYTDDDSNQFTKEDLLNFLGLIVHENNYMIDLNDYFNEDKPKAVPLWNLFTWALGQLFIVDKHILKYSNHLGKFDISKTD